MINEYGTKANRLEAVNFVLIYLTPKVFRVRIILNQKRNF